MLFLDEAQPFLAALPGWYVEILEARAMTCAPCQANWIEVNITDFEGRPSGESLFLMIAHDGTNTSLNALNTMLPSSGQSGRLDLPFFGSELLAEDETDMVVEIGVGMEHLDAYLYSDDHLDEDRDTVHYLAESPLEYDGSLSFSGSETDIGLQALNIYAEMHTFHGANRSEDAGAATFYFNGAVTLNTPVQFVGPDGKVYCDASGMLTSQACQSGMFEPANTIKEIDQLSASVLRDLNTPAKVARRTLAKAGLATTAKVLGGLEAALGWINVPQPQLGQSATGDIGAIAVFQNRPVRLGIGNFGRGLRNRARKTQRWIGKPLRQRSGAVNHSQLNAKFLTKTRFRVNLKLIGVKFNFRHIRRFDPSVPRSRGIGGAHSREEFMPALQRAGGQITRETPHPSIPGIRRVEYRMPALDRAGQPTGTMRAQTYTKTIYDPTRVPHSQIQEMVRTAFRNAIKRGNGRVPREWTGTASNGIPMRGYYDAGTKTVTSGFAVF